MKKIKAIKYFPGRDETRVIDEYDNSYTLWIDKSGDGQPIIRLVKEKND